MSHQRNLLATLPAVFCACALAASCSGGAFQTPAASSRLAASMSSSSSSSTYEDRILGDHPVQFLTLSGTAAGPLQNEASSATALDAGAYNAGVAAAAPAVPAGSSFSIETWVRPRFSTSYMSIWGAGYARRLLVNTAGRLLAQFSGSFYSKGALSNDAWHDVVYVYDASAHTQNYYIDGAPDSSAPASGTAMTFNGAYYLGQYDTGSYYKWHGSLAFQAVYAYALTAAQVHAHYADAGYPPAVPTPAPTVAPSPQPDAPCAGYRWSIKTAQDANAGAIASSPQTSTIAYLTGIPQPDTNGTLARMSAEEQTYRLVDVTLIKIFKAVDGDYHLLLSDGTRTMIAEAPDPQCAPQSALLPALKSVRAALDARYPNLTSSGVSVNQPVTLQGAGFFDYEPNYAQDQAPDGIELHPITAICFGSCTNATASPSPSPAATVTPSPAPTGTPSPPPTGGQALYASAAAAPATLFYTLDDESGAVSRALASADFSSQSTQTLTYTGNARGLNWGWVGPTGYPGSTAWPARTYDVSLQIAAPNANLQITEVKVYRVDANGGPSTAGLAVVADSGPLAVSLAPARTLSFSLNGAAQAAASSDRIAVKFYVTNASGASQSFGYAVGGGAASLLR